MSKRVRKVYSAAFKAKVGLEAIKGQKTINQIAQDFEVHPVQVSQWKKEIQERTAELFDTKRGPQPASPDSDQERLYSEIGKLKMQLDWLSKKSGLSL